MKYLKTYESYALRKAIDNLSNFRINKESTISSKFKKIFKRERSFWEWFIEEYGINMRHFPNFIDLLDIIYCSNKKIINLNGIEVLKNLESLSCSSNKLKNLKGIENLTELTKLWCSNNEIESLKGIENLKKLEVLLCSNNKLKNLDEIKNLDNLQEVNCAGNPFDEPIPIEIVNKFGTNRIYGESNRVKDFEKNERIYKIWDKFESYEFQKDFLTKYPECVKDLEPFGYHKKIKQEFPALIRGIKWGFFDLEDSK